ncbi:MAG: metallopeptidase TldD-related protein [Bacillota bacterium]|jgi:PmbA protein|nr:metallopeptidase TldD-related protein [Bacillota bacterium]
MLLEIKKLLENNTKISAWVINENISSSSELFFIKDKLDMNRACDTKEYHISIYVDFKENDILYKGDSIVVVSASDSIEEIQTKINDAVFYAEFVKNKWYDLPTNESNVIKGINSFKNLSILKKDYETIFNVFFKDYGYESKVNSCEIFAIEGLKRVISSKGTDVSFPYSRFIFELVTDCETGFEPVEIFNGYYLTEIDLELIEVLIKKQLSETYERSKAIRNEKLENKRVIISGNAVEEFLKFYIDQATDSSIYQKISKAKLNENFFNNSKEKLNIVMNPYLSSSINSMPVDAQGKILKPYVLYEDGVLKNLKTSARFSHYLNVENLGNVNTFEVKGGEVSLNEYIKDDYIEIMEFSSFIMDTNTGDFGGEFRLAKVVENGKESFITGGAISENIFDIQNEMLFSKETLVYKSSICPKAIILDNITVSGK